MELTDYYGFAAVMAEVHSCLASDGNLLSFGDIRNPI